MDEETNIDGRTKEGRALKAAGAGKESPADSKARAEARIRALRGNPVLMERPKMFTDEARAEEARAAREAVLTREAQMKDGRAGDLGRREVQRFSKSHERIAVPND